MMDEDQVREVFETLRRIEKRASNPPPVTHECLHEAEITDVRVWSKRRWMLFMLAVGSLLAVGGAIADVSLKAGEVGSNLGHVSTDTQRAHTNIEETRRDLVKASTSQTKSVSDISIAVGRLETKVENLTEAVRASNGNEKRRGR